MNMHFRVNLYRINEGGRSTDAGGLRDDAGVERADHLPRHPGADAAPAHPWGRRGHAQLQEQAVLQGRARQVHLCRCVIHTG